MKWEIEWSMKFNPSKGNVLTVRNKIKPARQFYKMHDIFLENVVQKKCLGVIVQRKLSWKPHASNVVDKANSTRYFL